MEFFNNTKNESLKFKLNSEGINMNKVEARLILTTSENINYFFIGKLRDDICEFNIPELTMYEKNDNGKIKFEIISEDLYFPVWEDNFRINSKASVKIEEMITDEPKIISKPKITSNIITEKIEQVSTDDISKNKIISDRNFIKKDKNDKNKVDKKNDRRFLTFSDYDF